MDDTREMADPLPYALFGDRGAGGMLLVCEHASNFVPSRYVGLASDRKLLAAHVAWDPGALRVARHLSQFADAPLVAGTVSRLVYDCNRPPEAPDAIPEKSEQFVIRGNLELSEVERRRRARAVHDPFHGQVANMIAISPVAPVLITIHSFTPIYNGHPRQVEIGVLHDTDARLADAMLAVASNHTNRVVARNEPYRPEDGVTYTLRRHGVSRGLLNVMIEIRNDLLSDPDACRRMAGILAGWLGDATKTLTENGAHT